MDNRRAHRFDIELPAFVKFPSSAVLSSAATVNVSAVGLCLVCPKKPKVGSSLAVELRLPNQEKAILQTEVVWVKDSPIVRENYEYMVGLRIQDSIDPHAKKFIQFYTNYLLKKFPQP